MKKNWLNSILLVVVTKFLVISLMREQNIRDTVSYLLIEVRTINLAYNEIDPKQVRDFLNKPL